MTSRPRNTGSAPRHAGRRAVVGVVLLGGVLAGCSPVDVAPTSTTASTSTPAPPVAASAAPTSVTTSTAPVPTTAPATTAAVTTTLSPFARPDWLGTRVLPLGPDGENGIAQPTPPELQDRRLETIDLLPPPVDGSFTATINPVPNSVIARSTWTEECPVDRAELSYLNVAHFGFDGEFHTGELIVNAAVAEDIVGVFATLHAARFPIEQMRVTTQDDLDAPPTGDGNGSGAFGCRSAVGTGNWSQHAFGLAIDINPFHNPYIKGELVIPELASAYLDRDRVLPGMVFAGDVVFDAFAAIGWSWGGDWNTLKDWMHFSQNGH
ncbi:MAG: M15 family metallopeptidase [bacterium]|nr:M15 family metallopeptidase [bacterium]